MKNSPDALEAKMKVDCDEEHDGNKGQISLDMTRKLEGLEATKGNDEANRASQTKRMKLVIACAALYIAAFWMMLLLIGDTDTFIVFPYEVESCSYVKARYGNCLRSLLSSPKTCNDCVVDALKQQKNQDPNSCDVFVDLYSSTCKQFCHKCVVAIENLVDCAMDEYDGCTIRTVPIPESATLQLAPNLSSSIINNSNNNNSVSINNVGVGVYNKTMADNASIAHSDSDNDGVKDYKDYCPGTEFTQRQQQLLAEEGNNLTVVDEFGCPLLHCSFGMLDYYMGIYRDGLIARAAHEVLFEVVECLDNERNADCVVEENERCVSIRSHDDPNLYWYHYEGGLYLSRANPTEPFSCMQASFCISPGLENTFTDRSTASFRPVYRSEYVFAGVNGHGAVSVKSKGESASWSFQCRHGVDDLWAVLLHGNHTSEHGLAPPADVQCM